MVIADASSIAMLLQIDPTTYLVALKQAEALKNQRQNEFDDAVKIRKQGFLSESEYLSTVTSLAVANSGLVQAQRNLDKTKMGNVDLSSFTTSSTAVRS